MKPLHSYFRTNFIWMPALLSVIYLSSSCAKKTAFMPSTIVPAAQGTIKVKSDKNKNYAININVDNLAEPSRLQPAKLMYIVWMETTNNMVKNIGQIKSSTNFMSSKLSADFETVSAIKPNKIFITAENDANVQYPLSEVILTTGIVK